MHLSAATVDASKSFTGFSDLKLSRTCAVFSYPAGNKLYLVELTMGQIEYGLDLGGVGVWVGSGWGWIVGWIWLGLECGLDLAGVGVWV